MSTDEKTREEAVEKAGDRETSVVQERLNRRLAQRDDRKVAQGLYAGEEIEEMHELSDAGLLDEFFAFLEEVGITNPSGSHGPLPLYLARDGPVYGVSFVASSAGCDSHI